MAKNITNIIDLQEYLDGVISRADCHAQNVREIVLPLIGHVILRGSDIEVKTYDGHTTNILWFTMNEKRFCFLYEHPSGSHDGRIVLKNRTMYGDVVATFNNETTIKEIESIFANL